MSMFSQIKKWRETLRDLHYNTKLKTKLILAYSFFIIIPILFVGLTSHYVSQQHMLSSEKQAIRQQMVQLMNTVEYFLEIYMNKSDAVFRNPQLQTELRETKTSLEQVLISHKFIAGVQQQVLSDIKYPNMTHSYYTGGTMHLHFYVQNESLRPNGDDIALFSDIESDPDVQELYESNALFSWQWGQPGPGNELYVTMSRRLMDFERTGDLGIMRLYIPVKRIQTIMIQNSSEADYSLLLSADDGQPVAATGSLFAPEREWPGVSGLAIEEGVTDVKLQGVRYMVGMLQSGITGWKLYYLMPLAEIEDRVGFITRVTWITVVTSVLLCVLIAALISSFMTKRIKQLVIQTNQIKRGDFHTVMAIKGNDEIGQLMRNFQSMMDRINHHIEIEYKSKSILDQTKLELLQEQINPHLYYNSLAMIRSIASKRGESQIYDVSDHLIAFYKGMLNRGKIGTSLQSEVDMVRSYIAIMQFVYDLELDVHIEVEEEVLACHSIKLILQPLVENAIVHGIRPQQAGTLEISGYREGDRITFTVSDDGVGMSDEIRQKLDSPSEASSKGYGLRNVRRRIQLFFGEDCGLELDSSPGAGTTVSIVIPAYNEEQVRHLLDNWTTLN